MAAKSKSTATGSQKDNQGSPSVISKIEGFIRIAVGIASIIKFCKDIFSAQ